MRPLHLLIPFAVALGASAAPYAAQAQFGVDVSVTVAPPELPVYEQPPLPEPGYIFMPGYWGYGDEGYYWIPGTWVEPPQAGLLWTPGYWGWNGGRYLFNAGYWGATVGFYGGINYGFGYGGLGYEGGYWRGGSFFYNRSVNNFGGVHVTNVFQRNVTNVTVNHYSFNGPNGVRREASPAELTAAREPHVQPTAMQMQHVRAAQQNHALLASVNHGRPSIAATPRPAAFGGASPRANGRAGMAPGTAAAPGPHPVTRNALPTRGAAPEASPAISHHVAGPGHNMTPHMVQHSATPHATYAPHEAAPAPRAMTPHEAPASEAARAPMHAPTRPAPMAHVAAAPHPTSAPHEAAPPKDEKPKR